MLLRSLSDKYPWERYEHPYLPGYRLNSITAVLLEGWIWHEICEKFLKKTPRGLDFGTRVDSKYASRRWGAGFPRILPRGWLPLLMGKRPVDGSALKGKDLKESTPSDCNEKISRHSLPRANLENELIQFQDNPQNYIYETPFNNKEFCSTATLLSQRKPRMN